MNKEYSFKVTVSDSRKEMGIAAGKCGERLICEALEKKETVRIIMASAPSQDDVLGYLRESKKIDWSRVEVFHMDEYIGVSTDNPVSFSNYLQKTVMDHVNIKAFHKLIVPADNPQKALDEYAKILTEKPIDVVFLGIGENGHVAFNDPWMADLKDETPIKIVGLDDVCRMQQVHDGAFATLDDVPKTAATLSVPTLLSGDHLVCTVPTANKNAAALRMMFGSVSVECPATAMRVHPDANIFLDNEAGAGISTLEGVKTKF